MPRQAPYLQRRGDTFFFRLAVPLDLRVLVGGRELTKTLRTADKRDAMPIALEFAAKAKRLFNDLRASMAVTDDTKLRELIRRAKAEMQVLKLKNQRDDEQAQQRLHLLSELKRVRLESENNAANRFLARSATSMATEPAPASESVPERRITDHEPIRPTTTKEQHRLSDAIPTWQGLKKPAQSTVEIYEAAVKRFEDRFPELFVETIEKRHIRDFVKWRQGEGKSAKTIEKEHGAIRALLSIAEEEEWTDRNVARGTLLPAKEGKARRSYTPDECRLIFSSSVFVAGKRPIGGKDEAAYWIPLLLLFTGARREEIGQLTTDRVRTYEGVPYLAIDPIDDEGRLKTDESKRAVPIHPELVRIGFLRYVGERVAAGGGQLFPLLKPNKRGQYCAKWGDWWRRYVRETIGITDRSIGPAHSFRHLFITECRRLGFREDYERALVGHTGRGRKDTHDEYGEHLVTALAAELNRINFRGLDLAHLA